MSDPRLSCVVTRLKEVTEEISDLEWLDEIVDQMRLSFLYSERVKLKDMVSKGELYEPNF